jgi:hypothetical protein
MIRWTRSARIVPAKFMEAIQWSKEVAEFISKKYDVQATVYIDSFGEYGTIRWFNDHADMATMEKFGKKFLADPEYWQIISRGPDLLVSGSIVDTVMRSI